MGNELTYEDHQVAKRDMEKDSETFTPCAQGGFTGKCEIDMKLDAITSLNDLAMSPIAETKCDSFSENVYEITNALAEMLISKNAKYGNSALEPKRIFSKASPVEQILVRIDDKLSRMSNQDEDEDVVSDLLGYLVLLKIAKGKTK